MKWAVHLAHMGERRHRGETFWGESRERRPLRRLRRRLENDINADREETECEGLNWIKLVQN
jgi:hypothetical protein